MGCELHVHIWAVQTAQMYFITLCLAERYGMGVRLFIPLWNIQI